MSRSKVCHRIHRAATRDSDRFCTAAEAVPDYGSEMGSIKRDLLNQTDREHW
jgi:hypothetical protein